jgi:transcription termination factor Rho
MADDLSSLHISELHARAAERGIEGYRLLRREQLVEALSAGRSERPARQRRSRGGRGRGRGRERERSGERAPRGRPRERVSDDDDTDELEVVGTVVDDEDPPKEELPTEQVTGVLDLTRQRFGFLRMTGLDPAEGDVYISASQVRRCELRPGDEVTGPAREARRGERHRALVRIDSVNGSEPESEERPRFDDLAAVLPERRIPLDGARDDVLLRSVDLLAPLALGQRVLVRAAPRSGRTTLLRSLARAAVALDRARVIVLLIDERPEEATAWREAVPTAEFAIATAEMSSTEQVRIAELALERSRRLAELGQDVILVCDSLSRLAIAAGDSTEVKRLFGSGRNLAGGGSLTVVATLVEGASDEGEAERAVITTESSLVTLDSELAAAGVHPALDPAECRVSNEDQIRDAEELDAARRLRSLLADLDPVEAAKLLRERIEGSAANAELLRST